MNSSSGNTRQDEQTSQTLCQKMFKNVLKATNQLYKLLSDKQHAFRKRHSCETQLTTVINDWAKILDNRRQVDTFILDFKKAFDTPLMNSLKANCLAMESVARH